jgi:hypothetical protein
VAAIAKTRRVGEVFMISTFEFEFYGVSQRKNLCTAQETHQKQDRNLRTKTPGIGKVIYKDEEQSSGRKEILLNSRRILLSRISRHVSEGCYNFLRRTNKASRHRLKDHDSLLLTVKSMRVRPSSRVFFPFHSIQQVLLGSYPHVIPRICSKHHDFTPTVSCRLGDLRSGAEYISVYISDPIFS